ncbi:MAG: UDP-N-acetylmuramate dehydrogenase, partial [bacterium]|nr:UDP-N-acetylmuramate dehydrogenase [bacterium]
MSSRLEPSSPAARCIGGYTTSKEDAFRRFDLAFPEDHPISTTTLQHGPFSTLEDVAGIEWTPSADLSRLSTFRIGGRAEWLATVHTEEALRTLLAKLAADGQRFHLVGLGSNVLFPDEGLEGLLVRLEGDFKGIRYDGTIVEAGAAVALPKLARRTAERGLSGLEPLCGFPSTVGGAVVMNAGCYGVEIKDVLASCRVLGRDGSPADLRAEDLEPGYRSTNLQGSGRIVVSARFRLTESDAAAALNRIDELNEKRWASLPMGQPNVGSIFKNPPGDAAGRLIDECGLKGLEAGSAQISPKHGNVIVNTGGASSSDVLELMLAAYHSVKRRFGVELEP